jgi:hypothetical protein
VPLPVPAKLFRSVTVYDPDSRSEIATRQDKAALRYLFELKDQSGSSVGLYLGLTAPWGHDTGNEQDDSGKGLVRLFSNLWTGKSLAFDGTWRPGDFSVPVRIRTYPQTAEQESMIG